MRLHTFRCHRQIDLSASHYSHFIAKGEKITLDVHWVGHLVRPKADRIEQNTVRTHFGQPVPSVADLAVVTLLSKTQYSAVRRSASFTTLSVRADACIRSCSGHVPVATVSFWLFEHKLCAFCSSRNSDCNDSALYIEQTWL